MRPGAGTIVLALCLFLVTVHTLHAGEGQYTIILKGNVTTSSQIYPNPDATDILVRTESVPLTDFFGAGIELRYRIPETSVSVGLSSDYIRATTTSKILAYPGYGIPVQDGYVVVPVEVNGYFIIPLSGENFGVFMGGGVGAYFGRRTYRLGDTEARLVKTYPGFGIHVLGGISYRFFGTVAAFFEMKSRDVQFDSWNAFTDSSVRYQNLVIRVGKDPFKSRVQTDGIVFQLGLAVSF